MYAIIVLLCTSEFYVHVFMFMCTPANFKFGSETIVVKSVEQQSAIIMMMHPGGQPATVGEVLMPIQRLVENHWKLVLSTLSGSYVDHMAFERDLIANLIRTARPAVKAS